MMILSIVLGRVPFGNIFVVLWLIVVGALKFIVVLWVMVVL